MNGHALRGETLLMLAVSALHPLHYYVICSATGCGKVFELGEC